MHPEIPDDSPLDHGPVEHKEVPLRGIVVQAILFTLALFGLAVLLSQYLEQPTRTFARWVLEELGLAGIFLSVLAADAFTFPVPPDTYLLVAVAAETTVVPILATVIVASLMATVIAYWFGPQIVKIPLIRKRVERFEAKGVALFQKYGLWTVTLAALTPIPFSIVCWFAGIYRMPFLRFVAATLTRIPRFIAYYYLIVLGWTP